MPCLLAWRDYSEQRAPDGDLWRAAPAPAAKSNDAVKIAPRARAAAPEAVGDNNEVIMYPVKPIVLHGEALAGGALPAIMPLVGATRDALAGKSRRSSRRPDVLE